MTYWRKHINNNGNYRTILENENIPGTIFSVDFEKAFDKIDWEYLDHVLEYYNFGPQLRKWVKLFYTDTLSTVNVNGWFT